MKLRFAIASGIALLIYLAATATDSYLNRPLPRERTLRAQAMAALKESERYGFNALPQPGDPPMDLDRSTAAGNQAAVLDGWARRAELQRQSLQERAHWCANAAAALGAGFLITALIWPPKPRAAAQPASSSL